MTKPELLQQLEELKTLSIAEPDSAHSEADMVLLEYINDPDISEVFLNIKRWYS